MIFVIENVTGISLDPFYYLNLILSSVVNGLTPLMPTSGPMAQSTELIMAMVNFVHLILRLLPSIILAIEAYKLIPDEN